MKTVQSLIITAICLLFVIIKLTQCANMFAELDMVAYCTDQRALCQNTGSFIHIVCEYYGKMGSCSKFDEISLDDSNEDTILHRINTMRANAAHGKVIGKGRQRLPRAYGMKKVFWDSELAAFAKIMIYQCISGHRYICAASKNFPSPMMAYSSANTTTSAATIIDNIFSSWEADALTTTPDEIKYSPDLKGGESRFYIKMVVGDVTHVGCAAGVYEHEIRPIAIKANDNLRVSGHLICYLSHYSREGTPVYNTTEPIRGTWWTRCGCPPKYRETKDCLCVPSPPSEHRTKRQKIATEITTKNTGTTVTSTKAYYENLEKYMQRAYIMELTEKTQLLDLTTEKQRKLTKQPELDLTLHQNLETSRQQKLEWSPKETLSHNMQQRLEPKIQQKLKETKSALRGVIRPPVPPCTGRERCEPKIVMLPIFTIENAPKLLSHGGRRGYRRSDNTSSVPSAKAIEDISFSDENNDELPKNMSIRSKVLETIRKIRQKQASDIFSNENAEHGQPNIERSQIAAEPTKLSVEPITSTVEPSHPTANKRSHEDHTENAKKSVMNLLALIEEQEKTGEPIQSIVEPSRPITNKHPRGDRNEKAKKRVMHLLDLLEEKGSKAHLNSREMIEFDAKMRRIYINVLGTTRKSQEGNFNQVAGR